MIKIKKLIDAGKTEIVIYTRLLISKEKVKKQLTNKDEIMDLRKYSS